MNQRVICAILFLVGVTLCLGCAGSSGIIQTQWDNPKGATIRIVAVGSKKNMQFEAPATIQLEAGWYKEYFVEIRTKESQSLFGTLKVMNKTQLTELSNVRIDVTDEIVRKVANNQVSQIVVNDPAEQVTILQFNIGNKMPSAMTALYKDLKLQTIGWRYNEAPTPGTPNAPKVVQKDIQRDVQNEAPTPGAPNAPKVVRRDIQRDIQIDHLGFVVNSKFIVKVLPGSPAEKAGLLYGDEIVSIDNDKLSGIDDSDSAMLAGAIGSKATLRIVRGGRVRDVSLERGQTPAVK